MKKPKHFLCLSWVRVRERKVGVWENEKCCGEVGVVHGILEGKDWGGQVVNMLFFLKTPQKMKKKTDCQPSLKINIYAWCPAINETQE